MRIDTCQQTDIFWAGRAINRAERTLKSLECNLGRNPANLVRREKIEFFRIRVTKKVSKNKKNEKSFGPIKNFVENKCPEFT